MSALIDQLRRHAQTRSRDIAIDDGVVQVTYGELPALLDAVAVAIPEACPGDRPIAVQLDNTPAWVMVDLALIKLKRVSIPIAPFFTATQRDKACEQVGAAFLLSDATTNAGDDDRKLTLFDAPVDIKALNLPPSHLPPGTAKVTFTSGTTADPKGVCLSQDGLEQTSLSLVEMIGSDYAGTHLAVLPLAVLLENVGGLYTTLFAGGRYRVLKQRDIGFGRSFVPDFAALARELASSRATSMIVVPEILRGLLQVLGQAGRGLLAMRLAAVGGARVAPGLLEQAEALGLPVFQGYGLSEAGSVVTLNTPAQNRPGSVGRALPHVDLSIDQSGEIHLRPAGFLGYANGEPAPSHYATGDLGRFDEDGYLHLSGRRSNVLITSFGRNVSPEWVESELLARKEIGQAFVFGDGEPALGALVVPSSAALSNADLAKAISACNAQLPEYARIQHWAKVFPFTPANGQLTPNGRLRRNAIQGTYRDLLASVMREAGQYVSFFERLVAETIRERAYLSETPQIVDGLEGRISLETYRLYLAEAFHHVRHTVPLFERVRDGLPPKKAWLREAAESYIEEELGHEHWILDDIRNAGGDADAVAVSEPGAATEIMVAYAYDFIARVNPAGFFGMVFVLEGTSTQLATRGAQSLMRSLGLGPECFRYLTSHGAIDLSHMQFLQGLLNRVTEPRDQADIIHMAKRMFVLFANVFRAIPHPAPVSHDA